MAVIGHARIGPRSERASGGRSVHLQAPSVTRGVISSVVGRRRLTLYEPHVESGWRKALEAEV